ncbi:MAG: hypothetical protein AB1Z98_21345 [Nannocystaceae bacterium]
MSSRTWVLLGASCVAILSGPACTDPAESDVTRTRIGPAGGTASSADSVLTIAILPGALEQTIELTIGPTNEPPSVYGPAYRVQPNLELEIPATVSYRYPLPPDVGRTAVGYVDPEDFASGSGRWQPLPLGRIDRIRGLATGVDDRLSLFYAMLDDGIDVVTDDGTTGPITDDGTTGDPTDPTVGPTTMTTVSSATTDSDTTGPDDTDDTSGESTGPGLCGTLPTGPLMVDEFMFDGTPLDGNSEDLTFSTVGSLIVRNGADLVQIDPMGAVTTIPTSIALPDTLGTRWMIDGSLVSATFTTGELLRIQADGTVTTLWRGQEIPNGVFAALDGNIFFTDFTVPQAGFIDAAGTMLTTFGTPAETAQANGIVYDPDRNFVFYVTYNQGILWRVDVTDLSNPGPPQQVLTLGNEGGADTVGLDGLALDECGNVYVVDQNTGAPGSLYRVNLDGAGEAVGPADLLVETFPDGIANAVFGQGPGWEAYETSLFLVGLPGRIFIVDVGIAGAPTPVSG